MTDQRPSVTTPSSQGGGLYTSAQKVHPRKVSGRYRRWKTAIATAILLFTAIIPWLRWDRGAGMPDQAVLFSFPNMRFYIFDTIIWAQEFYFLTAVLVVACFVLFLATALYGRVWCGFACPQTIWTDLFVWIEALVEGDRNARIALDKKPWTAAKLARKALKHALWLLVSGVTGFVFVAYFTDAPALARGLLTADISAAEAGSLALFAGGTYLMAGWVREQMCTYMCPWPRIQGGMLDEQTLIVGYDRARGEARGHAKKGLSFAGRGHCVDCKLCVQVCPVGIDIRNGSQLECIGCGLCVDACAPVMARFGLPANLIGWSAQPVGRRPKLFRPRTFAYLGLIGLTLAVTGIAATQRHKIELSVLADRSPVSVRLSDGSIRAGYTVRLSNHQHQPLKARLAVSGLEGAELRVIGEEGEASTAALSADADMVATYRVMIHQPAAAVHAGNASVTFTVTDADSGATAAGRSAFIVETAP